ncbi:hypothetical protein [Anatilimnocola floriformis]|uniref:hypothetical protein n=1 Tax=Anatilimnocola floriformis TaxID=2948575 RepID=UPI0020C478B5|nr:hypothetical protein [Anatilimnocola floriformis]
MLVGVVVSAISFPLLSGQLFTRGDTLLQFEVVGLILLICAGLWFVAGLMTIFKQLWAVYLGLVGSYLALILFAVVGIASFAPAALVPLMFFVIAIVQSHRVIAWAKDLLNRGISLATRP